jgi:hypothetical protein
MAEDPAYFTVAPWGYRALSPLIVHALWPREVVRGFRLLSLAGLALAGPLLFLFLRRQGAAEGLALLATGLAFFTPPVDEAFRNFFLSEPVGLPLLLAALLALEERRHPVVASVGLAAALSLGALTKEVFVLFLPGFAAAAWALHGPRGGLLRAAPAVLLALSVHGGLRVLWAPYPAPAGARVPDLGQAAAAALRILGAAPDWWAPLFACGFPLAMVSLLRPAGLRLARRYGLLLVLALALPFAAAIYTGEAFPADHFYTDDVPRLLLYALPILLALSLVALKAPPSAPADPGPAGAASRRRGARVALGAGAVLLAAGALSVPLLALDRYRRTDLRGRTDGPFVLAFCRESLSFARRLAEGKPVLYEPTGRRYRPGRSDPRHMERMRWFLREGWGERPEYGMEEVALQEATGTVVLPVLEPRPLTLGVELWAERPLLVRVTVNGAFVGEVTAGPEPSRQRLAVPASRLFRGDNRLALEREPADPLPPVRLRVLNARAAGPERARARPEGPAPSTPK